MYLAGVQPIFFVLFLLFSSGFYGLSAHLDSVITARYAYPTTYDWRVLASISDLKQCPDSLTGQSMTPLRLRSVEGSFDDYSHRQLS